MAGARRSSLSQGGCGGSTEDELNPLGYKKGGWENGQVEGTKGTSSVASSGARRPALALALVPVAVAVSGREVLRLHLDRLDRKSVV